MIELRFHAGTLELRGESPPAELLDDSWQWDPRSACHRAPASAYAKAVLWLHRRRLLYRDEARNYADLSVPLRDPREPRDYQQQAVAAWIDAGAQGVVVLPTGAGKTFVAFCAIAAKRRAALVVTPTLDLVRQWYEGLRRAFDCPIGVLGGGEHRPEVITVSTYESAFLHMPNLGNRFGVVVFDECHHLPSAAHALSAQQCLAPFRLGLSATPERPDGRQTELDELIGPTVYRRDIVELAGRWLADYDVRRIEVPLTDAERVRYAELRATYLDFVRSSGVRIAAPGGWSRFLSAAARTEAGARALHAWRQSKRLAFATSGKLAKVGELLELHRNDRALVFTENNATAYAISREFLIPVITHQTRVTERSTLLDGLRAGVYGAIATSKVLNEGVDVPEASVAIVVSGSGSVREHVQRLGRILRPHAGKRAMLYELVSTDTAELTTSARRRDHVAYR